MDLQEWLNNVPKEFPEQFDNKTPFQNPLIQDTHEETIKAVHDVMKFLTDMALPWPGNTTFALSQDSTWGFINILLCTTGALAFEHRYRPDGGEPDEESEDEEQEDVA